ncbi:hypothetical protein GCM10010198_49780 [Nocardia seriolae]|nr:hypothetical protein NSERKGN1266_51150 [Nocardia seriolae]GAM48416.1 hypothetical protein NS07_v2contig00073-0006 [Nocardia seriolae]
MMSCPAARRAAAVAAPMPEPEPVMAIVIPPIRTRSRNIDKPVGTGISATGTVIARRFGPAIRQVNTRSVINRGPDRSGPFGCFRASLPLASPIEL